MHTPIISVQRQIPKKKFNRTNDTSHTWNVKVPYIFDELFALENAKMKMQQQPQIRPNFKKNVDLALDIQ